MLNKICDCLGEEKSEDVFAWVWLHHYLLFFARLHLHILGMRQIVFPIKIFFSSSYSIHSILLRLSLTISFLAWENFFFFVREAFALFYYFGGEKGRGKIVENLTYLKVLLMCA